MISFLESFVWINWPCFEGQRSNYPLQLCRKCLLNLDFVYSNSNPYMYPKTFTPPTNTGTSTMKKLVILSIFVVTLTGCATLTNDPTQPINFVAPNCKGMNVECSAENKRGQWTFKPSATVDIRRSDDVLKIRCNIPDKPDHIQSIPSRIGGKSSHRPFSLTSASLTPSPTNTESIRFKLF